MSLNPPKHTEIKWLKKRPSKNRELHLDYNLIICEGTKTEPKYFKVLKDRVEQKEANRVQFEIVGTGLNTRGLFEYAQKMVCESPNGYSHVWLVYDKDDFPADNFNATEELCRNNSSEDDVTYHAIWSNQCIELWFLLHFMYLQSDLHRDEYYPKLTESLGDFGAYAKNREDIFDILFPNLDFAIANARKLDKVNQGKTPTQSAPGTKVFEIMEKFRDYLDDTDG